MAEDGAAVEISDAGDLWVFGYGSLMWRPGFAYLESVPAVLDGYHRSFCIFSRYWRGTPEHPGLVLGLNPGGQCRGVVFRVAAAKRIAVLDYLAERELCGYAYCPQNLSVQCDDGRRVLAYCLVADPAHPHYAGELSIDDTARIIMDAHGVAGLNRDYLMATLRDLEARGYSDAPLQRLLRLVEVLTGEIDCGSGI